MCGQLAGPPSGEKVMRWELVMEGKTGNSALAALNLGEKLHNLESSNSQKAKLYTYLLIFTLEICRLHKVAVRLGCGRLFLAFL